MPKAQCPSCEVIVTLPDESTGRPARCPKCSASLSAQPAGWLKPQVASPVDCPFCSSSCTPNENEQRIECGVCKNVFEMPAPPPKPKPRVAKLAVAKRIPAPTAGPWTRTQAVVLATGLAFLVAVFCYLVFPRRPKDPKEVQHKLVSVLNVYGGWKIESVGVTVLRGSGPWYSLDAFKNGWRIGASALPSDNPVVSSVTFHPDDSHSVTVDYRSTPPTIKTRWRDRDGGPFLDDHQRNRYVTTANELAFAFEEAVK